MKRTSLHRTIWIGMLGALAILAAWPQAAEAAWYNASWPYRKAITIDHTKVPNTNQTNFPVLINRTDTDWKSTGNGGHVGKSDGTDILFTSADGTTKLDHELETYTATTGAVIAWVRIPTLSTSTDTVLYLYYGNAGAASQQNATGVWDSNYKGVWHVPDGTTLTANDSTSNANNGTLTNTPTATTGQIDGAGNFVAASSQYIATGSGSSLNITGDITLSAWIKTDSATGHAIFDRYKGSGSFDGYGFDAGTQNFHKVSYWSSVKGVWVGGNTSIDDSAWHYVVVSVSGTTATFYNNGSADGTPASNAPGTWTASPTSAIGGYNGGSQGFFNGKIDEVRVSAYARSADWIATEYNNQASPATFYNISTEEARVSNQVQLQGGATLRGVSKLGQ